MHKHLFIELSIQRQGQGPKPSLFDGKSLPSGSLSPLSSYIETKLKKSDVNEMNTSTTKGTLFALLFVSR